MPLKSPQQSQLMTGEALGTPISVANVFAGTVAGLFVALLLSACDSAAPPCPVETQGGSYAKSAGCLVIQQQKVLLVENSNGKLSLPGGSAKTNEIASCTAHRETWEETGFDTLPKQLIRVNDNGFRLYSCRLNKNLSPEQLNKPTPPFRNEIRRVLWLNINQFDQYSWRYPESQQWLIDWLTQQAIE